MTRTEHLNFCSICIHQKDGMRKGIICGLTDQIADFEDTCDSFAEDPEVVEQLKLKGIEDEVIDKMASQGKRFLNYLLDLVFIMIFIFAFYLILLIILNKVAPSIVSDMEEGNKLLQYLVSFIVSMIYYTSFEAATGRSIAKYITKVVTEIGEKPNFKIIVVRSLCRFIPLEAFSFLFNDGSGWHDTISNTKVINSTLPD
jgi:uncharacterized RDD family membrane protein YckC